MLGFDPIFESVSLLIEISTVRCERVPGFHQVLSAVEVKAGQSEREARKAGCKARACCTVLA
jgi:hypothetical protein